MNGLSHVSTSSLRSEQKKLLYQILLPGDDHFLLWVACPP